ncbi:MAG: dual specificity protein phosphatase family protein [Gammaproteobacteria bacterium]|nr:dual specificity protein phosphatase family protein [Gammaproteobacteria bacterium]
MSTPSDDVTKTAPALRPLLPTFLFRPAAFPAHSLAASALGDGAPAPSLTDIGVPPPDGFGWWGGASLMPVAAADGGGGKAEKKPSSVIPVPGTDRVIHLSDYAGVGATAIFTGDPETVLVIDASSFAARARPPRIPAHVTVEMVRVDILDTTETNIVPHILHIVPLIDRAFRNGQQVFVNCAMGISRSASFVIAYLMFQDMSFADAYAHVSAHRPQIEPNMGFSCQLERLPIAAIRSMYHMEALVLAVRTAVAEASVVGIKQTAMTAVATIMAPENLIVFTATCSHSFLSDVVTALGDHYGEDPEITSRILSASNRLIDLRRKRLQEDERSRVSARENPFSASGWPEPCFVQARVKRSGNVATEKEENEFELILPPSAPGERSQRPSL